MIHRAHRATTVIRGVMNFILSKYIMSNDQLKISDLPNNVTLHHNQ